MTRSATNQQLKEHGRAELDVEEKAALQSDPGRQGQWVNGVSYWQDYMTIIEVDGTPSTTDLRTAS